MLHSRLSDSFTLLYKIGVCQTNVWNFDLPTTRLARLGLIFCKLILLSIFVNAFVFEELILYVGTSLKNKAFRKCYE